MVIDLKDRAESNKMSRTLVHFDRAAIVPTPKILVRTLRQVTGLLTPQFLGDHNFDCGSHAVVRAADFKLKGDPLACAIIRQKNIEGKTVQDIYIMSRASERAVHIIKTMNSMESRHALPAFEQAYSMNVHFSGEHGWGRDKHPWQRNTAK